MHLNTFKFLGYDKDENGKLVINKEQAKTVRRIYRDFLIGINPADKVVSKHGHRDLKTGKAHG